MSRLHRQKLRLRARQREEGVIDPDSDQIDAKDFQRHGTGRRPPRKTRAEKPPGDSKGGQSAQNPTAPTTPETPPS